MDDNATNSHMNALLAQYRPLPAGAPYIDTDSIELCTFLVINPARMAFNSESPNHDYAKSRGHIRALERYGQPGRGNLAASMLDLSILTYNNTPFALVFSGETSGVETINLFVFDAETAEQAKDLLLTLFVPCAITTTTFIARNDDIAELFNGLDDYTNYSAIVSDVNGTPSMDIVPTQE